MNPRTLSLLAALCATSATLAGGGVIESTFDADEEGWSTLNDATAFTWTDEFGNPVGAIRATDQASGQWWFYSASDAYLGDKSSFLGAQLSWDIYGIAGNQNDDNRADVMLFGTDLQIGINVPVEPVNGEWTSWSVIFDEVADWRIVSSTSNGTLTSTPATSADIEAVLADLQGLYLRGEYTVGGDSTAIDNVRLAPPPCGDVTGDGNVDLADLNLVLGMFGMDTSDGDANGDGTVNLADLNLVLGQFGGSC
jgi:predicted lipoprotein with Yx(FWY)xxD motif